MTTTVVNNLVFSAEDKLNYLELLIPVVPVPAIAGQLVPLKTLAAHATWVKGQKEIAVIMLMTMEPDLQQNLETVGACDMLKELKTLSSRVTKPSSEPNLGPMRKEYDSFVQNNNMHDMGKTVNEFHAMLKLHQQTLPKRDAPTLHAIRAGTLLKNKKLPQRASTLGLRGSRKLKPGTLSLYMGNGQCAAVETIRSYDLCFPSRLVIVLHNCHYAPSITKGVILVACLYNDAFIIRFENDNTISVSRNNLVYFSAIPRDGFYEIVLSNSNTNDSSMYVVSNKRAKLNLDSSLLWHYRLGHISKKRIEKLQHDGLLNSIDTNQEFLDHLKEHGIIAHRTLPYTPQHNGVFKRRNRTLLDMVYSMMSQSTLPKSFWDYALESAARILNMVPTKKVEKTPYEVWYRKAHKLFYLKVWGCEALIKRDTLTKPNKLEPRSIKCIFERYPKETMGYSFYYPHENKVFVAWNAKFFENSLITQEAKIDEPQSDIIPIRRSTRTRHAPNQMCLNIEAGEYKLGELNEPANYKAALLDPESDKWPNAMNVEMRYMKDNKVWDLVDLPPNRKTIGSKWLFKKKTNMDGVVHTYKARLMVKGYTQTPRIDYEETFSPIVDIRAIRILIAIDAFYDYEIWQMDVKIVFLN
ncbi:retrotransposon protein, putative, ty1-copia subclass [Tanacetum coccineum]